MVETEKIIKKEWVGEFEVEVSNDIKQLVFNLDFFSKFFFQFFFKMSQKLLDLPLNVVGHDYNDDLSSDEFFFNFF